MPETQDVHAQVLQALEESQRSFAGHRKCIIRLKQAQAIDAAAFRDSLNASLDRALLIFRREPCVERMLQLVANLVCFQNDKYHTDSELAVHLLQRMVPLTAARDKAVRFRACQLTAKLLNSLGEDAEVSEELYEEILQAMLVRLNDKVPVVRVHAVAAVARLQDPTDVTDPVTSEYMRLISSDTSKEVRKAVLANLGVSALTLPVILERLRDVKDDVRKYTYSVVAIKIDVKSLQIAQRVLLVGGLQDRCEAVRKACVHMMVSKWLPRCDNNPIKLLKLLDVELHPEAAERALRAILGDDGIKSTTSATFLPYHDNKKKHGDVLTAEEAFYWRVLGKVATERNNDELMETALPELPVVYEAITANLGKALVTGELMQLVPLLDFGDEVGRKRLYTMLGSLLLDYERTSPTLVPHLLAALSAMESTAEFVAFVGGVMRQVQASGEEKELDTDTPTDGAPCWRRHVLALGCSLLRMVSRFTEIALLSDYIKQTAEQLIQHPSEVIRHSSIECLGLFSLLDEQVAGSYMPLFVKVLKHDSEALQVTALSSMMDALLIFRQSSWNAVPKQLNTEFTVPGETASEGHKDGVEDGETDTSSVWNLVFSCLHHPSSGVRGIAAEGLAKLVLGGRIVSSKVEQQLLLALTLLYFSPLSESDAQLRQCLAIFFPAFAAKDPANALSLAHLAFPALKHIAAAPKASPLSKVNALQVGQYLLSVMDEAVDGTNGAVGAHLTVAKLLCESIVNEPSHVSVKVWARLLTQIRVNNTIDLEPLCGLVKQAQACAVEPTAATAIGKFAKSLQEVLEEEEDANVTAGKSKQGDDDEDDEDVGAVDSKLQGLGVKGDDGNEDEDDEESVKVVKADKASKVKTRPAPLSPTLMHQVKQRNMGEDVKLGGLFGHDEVPISKADKRPASKRGAAARRAMQDDDECAPGAMLSPHSPLRVRRSTRATKPAVSAVKKEVDLDKLLEQQEKKEKAAWLQRQAAEEEEDDDDDDDGDEA